MAPIGAQSLPFSAGTDRFQPNARGTEAIVAIAKVWTSAAAAGSSGLPNAALIAEIVELRHGGEVDGGCGG